MKQITKEVTIVKDIYIADDGTEFDDIDKCKDYEIECSEKTLRFYDKYGNKSDICGCLFVALDTREDVDALITVCEYRGITTRGIANEGVYSYITDDNGMWINITEKIAKINGGNNEN